MGKRKKGVLLFVAAGVMAAFLTACGNDNSYRDTLESGLNKYYTGQQMSRSEYNAVKSFNNWKSKQGTKTYSDWGG